MYTYWVRVRFHIDSETGLPHIYRHEVGESDVEEVLARSGADYGGHRGSRIALGQARSGRYLKVIYVPDPEPGSVFVVTAYEMQGKLLAAYKRRRKR